MVAVKNDYVGELTRYRDKDVTWSHVRDQVLRELWHTQFCCTGS